MTLLETLPDEWFYRREVVMSPPTLRAVTNPAPFEFEVWTDSPRFSYVLDGYHWGLLSMSEPGGTLFTFPSGAQHLFRIHVKVLIQHPNVWERIALEIDHKLLYSVWGDTINEAYINAMNANTEAD